MLKKVAVVGLILFFASALSFAQDTPRDESNRWEIELHGGGIFGNTIGDNSIVCSDTITTTCGAPGSFRSIGPNGENIPTPLLGNLPQLMHNGLVHPGSGAGVGARVGFDLTSHWQLEFTWDYSTAPIAYSKNEMDALRSAMVVFCDPNAYSSCSTTPGTARNLTLTDHTQNGGHTNSYMFNANYQWNTDRKFVPYVTFGVGAVDWSAGASFFLLQTKPGSNCNPQTTNPDCRLSFARKTEGEMGFGINFGAGAKYYFTKNWGVRADVRDTMSWADFTHNFQSVDIDGDDNGLTPGSNIPPTGTSKQSSSPLNQLNVSGGVFFRF